MAEVKDPEVTPPDRPQRPNGVTTTTGLVAAINASVKTEKWLVALNIGVVIAVLGLAGSFAAWVLTGSKAYAQTVEVKVDEKDKAVNQRVDRLEIRYENDRRAQAEQNQLVLKRLDTILERIDGGKTR